LIVIYGAPLAGKTTVAWELARSLGEKAAVVSADQLLSGSIAVSDADAAAELEMAHTQLRLMVANYLKNRYHVVVEGPFFFERDGVLHNLEADIDQLVALMRHLAQRSMIVRLDVSEAVLAARAGATGREDELAAALRIRTAAKGRYGDRFRSFDSGSMSAIEIAASVRESLG
jgi:broad-specificity NMP kinase